MLSAAPSFISSSVLRTKPSTIYRQNQQLLLFKNSTHIPKTPRKSSVSFKIRVAKIPPGVELPKVEPKLEAPFLGFTRTAEIWNSRACMIGLVGIFIVELILNKGILQVIGVDVGKGLDLPL